MPTPTGGVVGHEEETEQAKRRKRPSEQNANGGAPSGISNSALSSALGGSSGAPPPPPGSGPQSHQERSNARKGRAGTAEAEIAAALQRAESPVKALDTAILADAKRASDVVIVPAVVDGLVSDLETDLAGRIGGDRKYRRHLKDKADQLAGGMAPAPSPSLGDKTKHFMSLHLKANKEALSKEARNRAMPDVYKKVARQAARKTIPANPEVAKLVSAQLPGLEAAARQAARAGLGGKLETSEKAVQLLKLKAMDARFAGLSARGAEGFMVSGTAADKAVDQAQKASEGVGAVTAGFADSDVAAVKADMAKATDAAATSRAPQVLEQAKAAFKSTSWYQRSNPMREQLLASATEQSLLTTSDDVKGHSEETIKATYEAAANEGINSKMALVGKAVDGVVTNPGDRVQVDVTILIPVEPHSVVKVGFHFRGKAERTDSDSTKVRLIGAFQGAASVPGAQAAAEAGRSLEAESHSGGIGCMDLISMAYYRDWRRSSVVPSSFTDYLWGMGGRSGLSAYEEAEAWAEAQEERMHPEDSAMLGYTAAVLGQVGGDSAGLSGELRGTKGSRFTKKVIEERRQKLKNKNKNLRKNQLGGLYQPQRKLGQDFTSTEIALQGNIGNLVGSVQGRLDSFEEEPKQYSVEIVGAGRAPASMFGHPMQLAAQVTSWTQDAQKLFIKAMRYATENQEVTDPKTGDKKPNAGAQGGTGLIGAGGQAVGAAGEMAKERWVQGADAGASQGVSLFGGALGYLSLASVQFRVVIEKTESMTVTVSLDKGTTISASLLGMASASYDASERILPAVIYRPGGAAGQKLSLGQNRAMAEYARHKKAVTSGTTPPTPPPSGSPPHP